MRQIFSIAAALLLGLCVAMPAAAKDKKPKKNKKNKTEQFVVETPALQTAADSTAYLFGVSQSQGLKAYIQQQMGVDTAYIDDFARAVMERVAVDPTDKQAVARNAGLQIGGQIEQMATQFSKDYYAAEPDKKVDTRLVAAAILAGLYGKSDVTAEQAMQKFRTAMTERQKQNAELLYGSNREAGKAFLEENKKKEGVVVLPSGLQYKVLTQGNGPVPTATQKVKVNYEGHLIDGTEFDSSYKRGQAATFKANQVIKGWTEALTRMPVGSKWELYIPQELAYGDRETGSIKPYSTLIFTVELLGIEEDEPKAEATKATPKVTGAKAPAKATPRKAGKKK